METLNNELSTINSQLSFPSKQFVDEVGSLHLSQFADDVLALALFVPEEELSLGKFFVWSLG